MVRQKRDNPPRSLPISPYLLCFLSVSLHPNVFTYPPMDPSVADRALRSLREDNEQLIGLAREWRDRAMAHRDNVNMLKQALTEVQAKNQQLERALREARQAMTEAITERKEAERTAGDACGAAKRYLLDMLAVEEELKKARSDAAKAHRALHEYLSTAAGDDAASCSHPANSN